LKRDPEQIVRAAGIVLFCKAPHQFLLLRHDHRWDLPKGHSEPGESYLETALRETEEETGIAPQQIRIDPDFRFDVEYPVRYKKYGGQVFNKHVCYFLGHVDEKPELRITEHESARWFDWDPPHQIQSETIDPLLAAIARHWDP
jgi:8-oxo-dGTP pyrophosphatase MutT (NUDIX family)